MKILTMLVATTFLLISAQGAIAANKRKPSSSHEDGAKDLAKRLGLSESCGKKVLTDATKKCEHENAEGQKGACSYDAKDSEVTGNGSTMTLSFSLGGKEHAYYELTMVDRASGGECDWSLRAK